MSDVVPILANIEKRHLRKTPLPAFRVGDTVRVGVLIKEGEKEREQAFEGVVIKRTRAGVRASFTVRKISYGVGVERIFPMNTPRIAKVEVIARGEVRRNRLFYLRDLQGKAARIREKSGPRDAVAHAAAPAPAAAAAPAPAAHADADKK